MESKQLQPTLRTVYMRTAFQVPYDASVRCSLDTSLAMVGDGGFKGGAKQRGDNMRRGGRRGSIIFLYPVQAPAPAGCRGLALSSNERISNTFQTPFSTVPHS